MMISTDIVRTVVGIIGNITALILFLSPVPTFYVIRKRKTVGQYSPVPYLATFVNCALWVLYGLPVVHPHSILVITINGAGLLIELVYLVVFLIYSGESKRKMRVVMVIAGEIAMVSILAVLVLTLVHSTNIRSSIVGSICMVGNIMMYASPLAVMKLVITTKSVEFMPFFPSLFSFLNGACWTTYALIRFDPFIAASNGAGTLLGIAQLLLYATFYKSTKKKELQLPETEMNNNKEKLPAPHSPSPIVT